MDRNSLDRWWDSLIAGLLVVIFGTIVLAPHVGTASARPVARVESTQCIPLLGSDSAGGPRCATPAIVARR